MSEIRVKLLDEPVDRKGKKKATEDNDDMERLIKETLSMLFLCSGGHNLG